MRKLKDGLYGLIVGDALGVPFEFKKRGDFIANDIVGYGTYNLPEGSFSDDSSMTLATCHSIKEKKGLDYKDLMDKFLLWSLEGKYTPFGKTFGIGKTTSVALETYRETGSLEKSSQKDQRSNGNGALMRILPLIFIDVSKEEIDRVSALTHGHEISKEACRLYVEIGKNLLKGISLEEILLKLDLSEDYKRLRILKDLEEDDIKSSGYVVTSLEAALWSILNTTSYKECVLKAVNLGNDTDTIAAIAGGLAGIIYGFEKIPKAWIEKIKNKDLIEACMF